MGKKNKIAKNVAKAAASLSMAMQVMMARTMVALAGSSGGLTIDTSKSLSSSIGNVNPEQLIIGLALWMSRLIGTGMLIWGVYGYVTARKDGEAESMNGALGKLISGLVLICMPTVLSALGVLG